MAICPNGHDSASDDFCDICGMRIAGNPPPSGPAASRPGSGPAAAGEPCPRCGTARVPGVGQFCETCGFRFEATPPTGQPPWAPAPPPSGMPSSSQRRPPPSAVPPGTSGPSAPPGSPAPSAVSPLSVSASSVLSAPPGPSVPSVATAQPVSPTRPVTPYAPSVWTAVVSSDRAYHQSVQAASGPDLASVPFPSYYAERRFRLTGSQMRIGRRSVSRGLDPEIDLTGPPVDVGISRLHAVLIATPDGNWSVLDPGSANGTLVNGTEIPTGIQVPLHDGDRINLGGWTAITVRRG